MQWLKTHNPFFSNLVINSTFELDITNVTDPKWEDVIKKDEEGAYLSGQDYSLLLHQYGLTEVEAPRRGGTTYQQFKLVDMKGELSVYLFLKYPPEFYVL